MNMNKKQEVGLRLKQFREEQGISQKALAEKCGWGASRIGNYEAGVRSINLDDAEIIGAALNIPPYRLLFSHDEIVNVVPVKGPQPTYKGSFPVISAVQAGYWSEACEPYRTEDIDEFLETTERAGKGSYWLDVKGDSMTSDTSPSFPEGTRVLVDPTVEPENGKLVVAKLTDENEATFKRLVIDAGQKYLKPLNKDYKMMPINGNCRILGVVIDAKMKLF